MADLTQERLIRVFSRIISRSREDDPVTLSAKLVDRLQEEIEDSEGGVGLGPLRIMPKRSQSDDEPIEFTPKSRSSRREPEERPTGSPPIPKDRMILTPDDPEFQQAVRTTEEDRRANLRGAASAGLRVTKLSASATTGPKEVVKHFSVEQMLPAIHANTPEQFMFTPNGCPATMKVLAVRNVQAILQTPISGVKLLYSNPRVSEGRGERSSGGTLDTVVIGLEAVHHFWESDDQMDFDKAMEDIVTQLKGLYAPRRDKMGAMDIGPSPMDSWNAKNQGMKDSDSIRLDPSWSPTGGPLREVQVGGQTYHVPDTMGSQLDSVRRGNESLGNPGERR